MNLWLLKRSGRGTITSIMHFLRGQHPGQALMDDCKRRSALHMHRPSHPSPPGVPTELRLLTYAAVLPPRPRGESQMTVKRTAEAREAIPSS
jgi:hypothetical protein